MPGPIDEAVFDDLAERTLHALEDALDEVEGLEVDLESGILTLEFDDGVRFVVNSHRAARQIWMAAGANAWHFDADPAARRWTSTKTREDLWACIKGQIEEKLGRPVDLAAR
ncbi:MAG TPA: iron donor protein CyaY [Polyangiaceae bacterium]|nr:iron donor protein CyaY [Polyangiaceae bacterium]